MLAVAVVPTYNEVENLDVLIGLIREVDPSLGVLIVDDHSQDGTASLARRLAAEWENVQLLERPGKFGLGSAYRAGFARAIQDGAEFVVQIDADLSHDPADIPALLANLVHGADLAIGSRYVPGGRTEDRSRRRLWLSRWGNRFAAATLGLAVNDATGGFRAYRTDALKWMDYESVRAEGYGFQIEMTHRMVRAGGKIVEFPIAFGRRRSGQSKLSGFIVREALMLVGLLWLEDRRDRRSRRRFSG